MRFLSRLAVGGLFATSSFVLAHSPFDGTWRPDPQKPSASQKLQVLEVSQGLYECKSCEPPYAVKSDGLDHPVAGSTYYDTISITIVDPHTIDKLAKKGGDTVVKSTLTVSADGGALAESQAIYDLGPRVIELTSRSVRASAGQPSAHLLSGSWRLLQTDLTNHDEDTTFKVIGDTLSMSDHMGRSFAARLDGTDAPYHGDSESTTVSLKVIDSRTIEESDKKDGKVIKVSRWAIDADGRTMHARFDDTRGKVQEQTGHRVEGTG
jgi:hypothetical protein